MPKSKLEKVEIYVPTRKELIQTLEMIEEELRNGTDPLNATIPALFYWWKKKKYVKERVHIILAVALHLISLSQYPMFTKIPTFEIPSKNKTDTPKQPI